MVYKKYWSVVPSDSPEYDEEEREHRLENLNTNLQRENIFEFYQYPPNVRQYNEPTTVYPPQGPYTSLPVVLNVQSGYFWLMISIVIITILLLWMKFSYKGGYRYRYYW
ncbi:041L [Cherax quadricarinatus iridovirus]|uniref:Uncharacterized protein n=1 Tax=Shrimp hemocyte iridescent virus TaxID=2039780 RepID=A0A291B0V9_9VIRU|nr:041L [Cherax quadricarinatus iridovirus]YP_010084863.1 hypothetical protein KM509_gp111 [Shrimp hemocyte iridescent virus]UPA43359.1 hypothetical protein 4TH000085 [Iridovirus CN01]ASZ85021.1 041L [Cherax quadricarinatus iridovirus]ATE87120.1 hypothetical protein [Shrimp hemocyte iridescent virus]UPA43435.1 hypothetical protein 3TG000002 [Iridovirus CN01]UPA43629.1 hypothetical protein 1DG000037 [Iridovirus CN01]